MKRLEKLLNEKNETVTHRKEFSDFHKEKKKRELNKKLLKSGCIAAVVLALVGFIYIPQFFIKENKTNETNVNKNASAIGEYNTALKTAGNEDWDNDGVINSLEQYKLTNEWKADTDGDGYTDVYELNSNSNPAENNHSLTDTMKDYLSSRGEKYDMAFKINDVTLWADDIKSRTYGYVVPTPDGGFEFTNFKGYAQFSAGTVAYKIENGKHIRLKYRKKEDAYYINGDCTVYVYESPLKMTNKVTFFNSSFYTSDNLVTKALSFILPDKGFIASERMASVDAETDYIQNTIITNISKVSIPEDINKFSKNNTSLTDMAMLRKLLSSNNPIVVSLYDKDEGEYLGIVYGFTKSGNLLIADYYSKKSVGELKVHYTAETTYDGQFNQREYFNFEGLGFNSKDGDRIRFLNKNFN